MQSINLLKKYPIKISLYYNKITNEIFQDRNFIEINSILENKNNINKYEFALYTDLNLLKPNIFIPIFDTLYLASRTHHVILNSTDDFWLPEIYKNNQYFYVGDSADKSIKSINSITEITNEI
jgi:hypothetical protein